MFIFFFTCVMAVENWKCFNWKTHQNFTKDSSLYQDCNKECGWVSSCIPCRIIDTDLYSCLDTQSNIDTYKYACGDLEKQFSCIVNQGIQFWFVMFFGFVMLILYVSIIFYISIRCWTQ